MTFVYILIFIMVILGCSLVRLDRWLHVILINHRINLIIVTLKITRFSLIISNYVWLFSLIYEDIIDIIKWYEIY